MTALGVIRMQSPRRGLPWPASAWATGSRLSTGQNGPALGLQGGADTGSISIPWNSWLPRFQGSWALPMPVESKSGVGLAPPPRAARLRATVWDRSCRPGWEARP